MIALHKYFLLIIIFINIIIDLFYEYYLFPRHGVPLYNGTNIIEQPVNLSTLTPRYNVSLNKLYIHTYSCVHFDNRTHVHACTCTRGYNILLVYTVHTQYIHSTYTTQLYSVNSTYIVYTSITHHCSSQGWASSVLFSFLLL